MERYLATVDTVKVDDLEIEYFKFGVGEKPLIIIPGISMKKIAESKNAVLNAFQSMCKDYTIYVIDRKNNMQEGYTAHDMADDTKKAIDALGLKDVYAYGASQGGAILQDIAIKYPGTIKKLVLCSTFSKKSDFNMEVYNKWIDLSDKGLYEDLNLCFYNSIYTQAFCDKYKKAFKLLAKNGSVEECKRFSILLRACVSFDCFKDLHKINCDTLVIAAENDVIVSLKGAKERAESIGCDLYIYEGYGHAVYDEAPDYVERLKAFFDK